MSGDEIESASHADTDRDFGEPEPVHMYPLLLLWIAECNQQYVRMVFPNLADYPIVIHVQERSDGRRDTSHDLQSRMPGNQFCAGSLRYFRLRTQHENTVSLFGREGGKLRNQVRARHTLR